MKKILLPVTGLFLLLQAVIAQPHSAETPQWRPVYHFTPLKNWTNDPNGLIFLNGKYHLYNQQNPFENKWGHMSWGHATSSDLIHWEHLPLAIPETIGKDTTWIFSGSAVWDKNNTSGFCRNGGCLVAIYTAHQPNLKKESQFIAYSNDEGITYTNYVNNPVIDLQKSDFRDPNVMWYAPSGKWLMTVVLPTEHKARFYDSPDLKNWNLLSEFGPQGYTNAAWECPFLIQLPVEGKPGLKKWVLAISGGGATRGAYMQYFVGDFNGKEFKNDNPADTVLTVDYGDCFYAAIPWNGLPEDRKTFIGWMVPNPQETSPWKGQMSIPRDLSLRQAPEGIRLVQKPSAVVTGNLGKLSHNRMIEVSKLKINQETPVDKENKIKGNVYWLSAELSVGPGAAAGFKIAQKKDRDTVSATVIGYDAASHEVYVDRSNSGGGKVNANRLRQSIALKNNNGKIKLEILLDKSSLEVFVNDGESVISTYIYPDEDADKIAAFVKGGNAVIETMKIWDLSKINE